MEKEIKIVTDADGTTRYYLNGKLHREDGPAIEYADGTTRYYLNGKLHREDGPAIEYADGTKEYFLNGKLHREDGPAIEYADGSKYYYLNGNLHRTDGPAIEYPDGSKYYYLNGKRVTENDVMAAKHAVNDKSQLVFSVGSSLVISDNTGNEIGRIALTDKQKKYLLSIGVGLEIVNN
jgi:uncharacterized protein (UPF0216 family)